MQLGNQQMALIIMVALLAGAIGGFSTSPEEKRIRLEAQSDENGTLYRQTYRSLMDSVVSIKVIRASGTSQGSGFMYDASGHIVTNYHVIRNARAVEIKFRGGEWRTASLVGKDVYSDLAVLKVDNVPGYVEPLQVAEKNPDPGDPVMALGNPFGLQETITHGIVSGVNRTMQTSGNYQIPDTIQTDAPINPGNSGGPLVDSSGKVVGVNRAKQGDNIGFAISPRIVNRVVPSLIQDGSYTHPYLGVSMETVSPRIAEANGVSRARGVIVVDVSRGPASGILEPSRWQAVTDAGRIPIGGDIILGVNGRKIEDVQELSAYMATETRPGERIELTILRNGKRQTIQLTAGERPEPGTGTPIIRSYRN